MKQETKPVSIRIPKELHDRIKFEEQKKTGKTITTQVIEAIEKYLEGEGK